MKDLSNPKTIKHILRKYEFNFSKSLGQNFLINPSVCPKMAKECFTAQNKGIIEVGPGIGVLTRELSEVAKKVVAIEIDQKLIPVLNETLKDLNNTKIINTDALKCDFKNIIDEEMPGLSVSICANLPYYITSEFIMYILEQNLNIESLVLMVQKETAKRLCASPGMRISGAITLAVNYYCVPEILFTVPRGSFMPEPKVDSAVIKLTIRKQPPISLNNKELFFKIIKLAFSKRRKTIINAFSGETSLPKPDLEKILNALNIDLKSRPEQLTLKQFADISNKLAEGNAL